MTLLASARRTDTLATIELKLAHSERVRSFKADIFDFDLCLRSRHAHSFLHKYETVLGVLSATKLQSNYKLPEATDFMNSTNSLQDACEFRVFWHEVQPFIPSVSALCSDCPRVYHFVGHDC